MSRGLGAAQMFVLAELAKNPDPPLWPWRPRYSSILGRLAGDWAHHKGTCGCPDYECEPDPAEVESVRRAVRTLERGGLVETRWDDDGAEYRPYKVAVLTSKGARVLTDQHHGEDRSIDYPQLCRFAYSDDCPDIEPPAEAPPAT